MYEISPAPGQFVLRMLKVYEPLANYLTRTSRNQTGCSCTRQSADGLPARFPPSGDGSYNVNPAIFAQHFIDKILKNIFWLRLLE